MSSRDQIERGYVDRFLRWRLENWASQYSPPADGKARLMEAVNRSSRTEWKRRKMIVGTLKLIYRFLSVLLFSIDWTISPSYLSQNINHAELQPSSMYKQMAVTSLGYAFPLGLGFIHAAS